MRPRGIAPRLILLAVGLMTASCGFHLRGRVALPEVMHKTFISGLGVREPLNLELRRTLRANRVQIVDDVAQASAVLRILGRNEGKRVLSVGGDGKVKEYELYLTVSFDLQAQDNSLRLAPQTQSLTREFIFDETDVLGKAQEEALLRRDMYKDMAQLMLYRLGGEGYEVPQRDGPQP